MKKAIFIFTSLLLMVSIAAIPSDSISAKTASSPQLSPPSPAQQEEETKILDEVLEDLNEAKGLTDDYKAEAKDIRKDLDLLRVLVRGLKKDLQDGLCAEEEDQERCLRRKHTLYRHMLVISRFIHKSKVDWQVVHLVNTELGRAAQGMYKLMKIESECPEGCWCSTEARAKESGYTLCGGRKKICDYHLHADPNRFCYQGKTPPSPPETTRPPEEIEKKPGYSVKVLCGPTVGKEGVERGVYSTVINIHNPSNKTITIWIKAVEAKPVDETRGKISGYKEVKLKPDEAIKVDCSAITKLLEPSGEAEGAIAPSEQTEARIVSPGFEFVEGFVVIRSPAPLDVVAVYTSETPGGSNFQVKDYSPTPVSIFPTEEEIAPPTTEEAAPPTAVTPAATEVTPAPPEEEAAKVGEIIIDPASDSNEVGTMHFITIRVFDTGGSPVPNTKVHVSQSGAHTGTIALVTGTDGKAGYYYIGQNAGTDTIVATVDKLSASAIKEWYIPETDQPETGPADLTPTTESDLAE